MFNNEQLININSKIRRNIGLCNLIACAMASLLEIVITPMYIVFGLMDIPLSIYIMYWVILPIAEYCIILSISQMIIKFTKSEAIRNIIPLVAMSIITMCIIHIHYAFVIVLVLPTVPILLSIAYGSDAITGITAIISTICYTIGIIMTLTIGKSNIPSSYAYDIIIGYFLLIGIYIIAKTLVNAERDKLLLLKTINDEKLSYKMSALLDERTKIANLKGLEDTYKEWIKNAKQPDVLYISIIDIDNFKSINDNFGHPFGDVVLERLGKLLNQMSNKNIFVSRYGGEEFVLIFKNMDENDVNSELKKLLTLFSAMQYRESGATQFTFSAGYCRINKSRDLQYNVGFADIHMYKAKGNGKNQICGVDSQNNRD